MVSIAKAFYREQVHGFESNPDRTPEALEVEFHEFQLDVEAHSISVEDDEVGKVPEAAALALALLQKPNGAAHLAYRARTDIDTNFVTIA